MGANLMSSGRVPRHTSTLEGRESDEVTNFILRMKDNGQQQLGKVELW
jgi:hypothetical protein